MKVLFSLVAVALFTVGLSAQEKIDPKIEAKPAPKIEVKDGLPRIPPANIPDEEPTKPTFPPVPIPEAGQVLRGKIVIEVLDPTDGGIFQCTPDMVESVKAHIAAKQRGQVVGASTPIVATCTGPNCNAPVILPQSYQRGFGSGRFFPLSVPASGCVNGRCPQR